MKLSIFGLMMGMSLAMFTAAASADDYAQWRGPRRDGISLEKNIAAKWPVGGPKLVWQVKDAGFGYGSVSVAGERVVSEPTPIPINRERARPRNIRRQERAA